MGEARRRREAAAAMPAIDWVRVAVAVRYSGHAEKWTAGAKARDT